VRFLIDENLPVKIVQAAQDKGISVQWVRDVLPGAKDSAILERLRSQTEVLVTRDIRFANLVLNLIASGVDLPGVILIREQHVEKMYRAWMRFLETPQEPRGLAVVTESKIRFRRPEIG
jgi:predicted nuclease of predicted toxin-antitoxin system